MQELLVLLRVFLTAIARAFFPALFDEARKSIRDTAEDAKPQPELKARLERRILSRWRIGAMAGLFIVAAVATAGCGTRVLFISEGEPIRLREPLKKVPVWVMGADGIPVKAVTNVPAGWFVLSDPGVDAKPDPTPDIVASTVQPPAIPEILAFPAVRPASSVPLN